jgi:hypothetical protein
VVIGVGKSPCHIDNRRKSKTVPPPANQLNIMLGASANRQHTTTAASKTFSIALRALFPF